MPSPNDTPPSKSPTVEMEPFAEATAPTIQSHLHCCGHVSGGADPSGLSPRGILKYVQFMAPQETRKWLCVESTCRKRCQVVCGVPQETALSGL